MADDGKEQTLSLDDYDVIGFDIDHTLAKYNIPNLFDLVNDSWSSYVAEHKGYDEDIKQPFDKDFCTRGIVLDRPKGNFLKLSEDGYIFRATHGTREMSHKEIEHVYGKDQHWPYFQELLDSCNNKGDHFRIFENFFDMPIMVVAAKMIDQVDKRASESGTKADYDVWNDLIDAINDSYSQKHFSLDMGGFFPEWKRQTARYVEPCSGEVRAWLRRLKAAGKKLFIMTSSFVDYATTSMRHVLGDDWQDYFDLYITNARKPGFFKLNRPFLKTEKNERELYPVQELVEGGVYSQGNLAGLNAFLAKLTGKQSPKVLYVGDSLRSDMFPGKQLAGWDTMMVLEEMLAEQCRAPAQPAAAKRPRTTGPSQLEKEYLTSEQWGSFFTDTHSNGVGLPRKNTHAESEAVEKDNDDEDKEDKTNGRKTDKDEEAHKGRAPMNTLWGLMIRKYADLAIPQLEYITDFPLDHRFAVFEHSKQYQWGFYPDLPQALRLPASEGSPESGAEEKTHKTDKQPEKSEETGSVAENTTSS